MKGAPLRVAICAAGEIWGGVEQFVETLVAGLAADAIVLVILFHEGELARRLRHARVPVHVMGTGKYHPRLVSAMRRLLVERGTDVLHVHGYKATIVGALAARGTNVRVVKTEHGRLERLARWRDLPSYARMAINVSLDRVATWAAVDAVAFVSRDIQRATPRIGRVIYNGIRPAEVADGKPGWRTPGHFHAGIVGRLDAVKGHACLFDALRRLSHLPDLRLHVFGSGPLEADLRRRCRAGSLESVVTFHGFQSPIEPHLCALDLLVMPSLHEGLPYALLEAMQLGVPVVASRVGGLIEALGGDCGVLVPAGDDAAMASAIERLYHNADLRGSLADRARRRIASDFHAAGMVGAYSALYRDASSAAS